MVQKTNSDELFKNLNDEKKKKKCHNVRMNCQETQDKDRKINQNEHQFRSSIPNQDTATESAVIRDP